MLMSTVVLRDHCSQFAFGQLWFSDIIQVEPTMYHTYVTSFFNKERNNFLE